MQGLGAALVAPAALALLTTARPAGPARARALGWWTAAAAGGGAGGWVLGGLLSGLLDWRWVFLVNVPVCARRGGARAAGPARAARARRPRAADVAGAVLATGGLAALVLALTLAEARGPGAGATLGALAAAVAVAGGAGARSRPAPRTRCWTARSCAGPASSGRTRSRRC